MCYWSFYADFDGIVQNSMDSFAGYILCYYVRYSNCAKKGKGWINIINSMILIAVMIFACGMVFINLRADWREKCCTTYYKYPDYIIREMDWDSIQKWYGSFDWKPSPLFYEYWGGYYAYMDEQGNDWYYTIHWFYQCFLGQKRDFLWKKVELIQWKRNGFFRDIIDMFCGFLEDSFLYFASERSSAGRCHCFRATGNSYGWKLLRFLYFSKGNEWISCPLSEISKMVLCFRFNHG